MKHFLLGKNRILMFAPVLTFLFWPLFTFAWNFGTGADGAATVSGNVICTTTVPSPSGRATPDCATTIISSTSTAGQAVVSVLSIVGFSPNDEVMLLQISGAGSGSYEFNTVSSTAPGTITLGNNLRNTYSVAAEVVRVPNYTTLTLNNGATFSVSSYTSGGGGGILAFRAKTSVTIGINASRIDVSGKGFGAGSGGTAGAGGSGGIGVGNQDGVNGFDGAAGNFGNGPGAGGGGGATSGSGGLFGSGATCPTGGGGGGSGSPGGGGGGGYGSAGFVGGTGPAAIGGVGGGGGGNSSGTVGSFGNFGGTYGSPTLSTLYFGSSGGTGGGGAGGGGGGQTWSCGTFGTLGGGNGGGGGAGGGGGSGGGIIYIETPLLTNRSSILANGTVGSNSGSPTIGSPGSNVLPNDAGGGGGGASGGGGGGGAGGSIYIRTANLAVLGTISALGANGTGGGLGGNGGDGGSNCVAGRGGGGGGGGSGSPSSGGGDGGCAGASGGIGPYASPGTGGSGGRGRIRCHTTTGTDCTTVPTAYQTANNPLVGELDSTTFDTGVPLGAQLNSVLWQGRQPVGTSVYFQFAGSNASSGPWNFLGPDGTVNTFYLTGPSVSFPLGYTPHNNMRYFRYRIYLQSDVDQTVTPRVDDVYINWSP